MKGFIMLLVVVLLGIGSPLLAADVPTVDKDQLKGMIGSADLVLLDVRTDRDWSASEFMIKGASREEPSDVDSWAGNYDKGMTIVLYCA